MCDNGEKRSEASSVEAGHDSSGLRDDSKSDEYLQANVPAGSLYGRFGRITREFSRLGGIQHKLVNNMSRAVSQFKEYKSCSDGVVQALLCTESYVEPEGQPSCSQSDRRSASSSPGPNRAEDGGLVFYGRNYEYSNVVSSQLHNYFIQGNHKARRLLHDSIGIEPGKAGDFESKLDSICKALERTSGWIVSFHDECGGDSEPPLVRIQFNESDTPHVLPGPEYEQFLTESKTQHEYWIRSQSITINPGTIEEEHVRLKSPVVGHFHVIHVCEWYNSCCKHLGRTLDVNRRFRTIRKLSTITECHFKNILQYIQSGPRWLAHYKDPSGSNFRFVLRTQSLPIQGVLDAGPEDEMDQGNHENQVAVPGSVKRSKSVESCDHDREEPYRKQQRKGDNSTKEILEVFLNHVATPIDHLLQTYDWFLTKYKYLVPSDKLIKRAIYLTQMHTMHWTYANFVEHYLNPNTKIIFNANGSHTLDSYYYDLSDSIDVIETLLDYQLALDFNYSDLTPLERKQDFITNLYNVLERKLPKRNSFCIISPPCAGKNFLFDAILCFYWNVGLIQNFNRNSQFPLMEAVDRRVNFWNEPNYEPAAIETLKMLLGGDPCKCNVKHEKERILMRTPVIIASNNTVFKEDAFKSRCFFYRWNAADFLSKYDKKPHPMIWRYLVETYVLSM